MIRICVPIYREVPTTLMASLLQISQAFSSKEISIHVYTMDSLISRQRNRMFSDFYLSKDTHMITFDVDCVFSIDQLKMLLEHKDKDVFTGMVPFKSENPKYVLRKIKPLVMEGPLVEVTHVSDFQIMSHKAAEKIVKSCSGLEYVENVTKERRWAVYKPELSFNPELNGMEYLDETWSWCERARSAGCRLWIDTRINLGHLGSKVYKQSTLHI